jgi:DNA-binding CsgD family transcriptional regulator
VRGTSYERSLDKLTRLAGQSNDLVSFWREATTVLTTAVPHGWAPCWYTMDPASLLITSHFQDGMAEFPSEWLSYEYYEDDVNQLATVARSGGGISTLHEATGGDPSRSPRWQRNMRLGGDQELLAALRTRSGESWGALGLYREPGKPFFDPIEKRFLHTAAPYLAEGARRALLVGEATEPEGPDAPGLVVLDARLEVESTTPGVERWLAVLPDGNWEAGRLPSVVRSVAVRAQRGEAPPGEVAMARVLSSNGTWLMVHGAPLVSDGSPRVAVIVEPAHPARIYPLLMAVYGLTARERDLVEAILRGSSTAEIAAELVVSVNTVQQHLKSVFDKTGVRSRRDLVGKVFFAHYEPRFRDNERRVARAAPVRGGPAR